MPSNTVRPTAKTIEVVPDALTLAFLLRKSNSV